MNKVLRFGIVGCGAVSNFHAQALQDITNATIIGFTDPNSERLSQCVHRYGSKSYTCIDEMLSDKEIDVISVCTPSGQHADLAVKIMEAGKHAVIEKPLALTVKDCDRVIEVSRRTGMKCAVVSQLRCSEAVRKVKHAIDTGVLGRITETGLSMKYYRAPEYYSSSEWRGTWSTDGGGVLMNQGIHGIDIMLYLMGNVRSVFGYTKTLVHKIEVEDTAVAVVEYENSAIGTIEGTTSILPGYPRRFEICGELGSIVMVEDTIEKWDIQDETNIPSCSTYMGGHNNPMNISCEGHKKQFENIIDAIMLNSPLICDAVDGKRAVQLINAIYKSAECGEKIILR